MGLYVVRVYELIYIMTLIMTNHTHWRGLTKAINLRTVDTPPSILYNALKNYKCTLNSGNFSLADTPNCIYRTRR